MGDLKWHVHTSRVNTSIVLLECIADLGGAIGCRGRGRFGCGRPEEPEEGDAIAAGSLMPKLCVPRPSRVIGHRTHPIAALSARP
jgi:hypothetical protein